MLRRIILHLARDKKFPEGSSDHGYEIIAPLDKASHLDREEWKAQRDRCVVRRFWGHEPDKFGLLVHHPGGLDGAAWMIDYDQKGSPDADSCYRLDRHVVKVGEYISIREAATQEHTFKVAAIE